MWTLLRLALLMVVEHLSDVISLVKVVFGYLLDHKDEPGHRQRVAEFSRLSKEATKTRDSKELEAFFLRIKGELGDGPKD